MAFALVLWLVLYNFVPWCVRAISFVGGDAAGRHIYNRGSNNGKRVQCNMGAKNHGVIMPDANKVPVPTEKTSVSRIAAHASDYFAKNLKTFISQSQD